MTDQNPQVITPFFAAVHESVKVRILPSGSDRVRSTSFQKKVPAGFCSAAAKIAVTTYRVLSYEFDLQPTMTCTQPGVREHWDKQASAKNEMTKAAMELGPSGRLACQEELPCRVRAAKNEFDIFLACVSGGRK